MCIRREVHNFFILREIKQKIKKMFKSLNEYESTDIVENNICMYTHIIRSSCFSSKRSELQFTLSRLRAGIDFYEALLLHVRYTIGGLDINCGGALTVNFR